MYKDASKSVRIEKQNVGPQARLYSKQFDKLLHDVSYGRTHSTNSQPFRDCGAEEKERRKGRGS